MSWKRGSSVEMSEEDEENCDVLLVDESEFLDEEALLQPDADDEDQDASTNDDLLEGDGSEQMHGTSHHDALTDQEGDRHGGGAVKSLTQEQPVSQEQNESEKAEKSNSDAAKEDISESQPSAAEGAQEPPQSKSGDAQKVSPLDDLTGTNKGSSKQSGGAWEDRPSLDIGQQRRESYRDRRTGSARSHASRASNEPSQTAAGKPTGRSSNGRSFHGSAPNTRNGVPRSQEAASYSSRQQHLRGRASGTVLRSIGHTGARAAALPLHALTRPAPTNQKTDLQQLLLNALTAAAVAASAPARGMPVPQLVSGPARTPFMSTPLAPASAGHMHRDLQEPTQRFPAAQRVQQEQPQQVSARPYDTEGRMMHRVHTAGGDGPANAYEYQGHPTQQNREAAPAVTGRRADTGGGHPALARDNGEEKVRIDYNHGTGDCDYRIPHLQQQKTRGIADGSVSQSNSLNLHIREALPVAKTQPCDLSGATTGEQPPGTRASPGCSRSENSRQAASDGCAAAATEPFSHQPDYGSKGMADRFVSEEAKSHSGSKHDTHVTGVDDAYLKGLRQQELRREEIVRRKEAQRQLEAERKRLELERSKEASIHRSLAGTASEKKSLLGGSVDRQLNLNRGSVMLRLQPQSRPADVPTREAPAAVNEGEKNMAVDRAAHGAVQQGQPAPKRRLLDALSEGAAQAGTIWRAPDNTGKSPAEKQRLLRQRLLQLQQQSGMKRKLSTTADNSCLQHGSQSLSTAVGISIKRDVGENGSTRPVSQKPLPVQQQPASADMAASRATSQSLQRSAWHAPQWQQQDSQEHRHPERGTNSTASCRDWPLQSAFSDVEPTTMNSDRSRQSPQSSASVPRKHYEPAVQPSADVYNRLAAVSHGITSVRVWNISASTTLVTLCMLAAECGMVNNAFFTNISGQAIIEFATDASAEMFCRKYNNRSVDRAIISAALNRR